MTLASLSLEGSQHIYKFLSKRPYLVRQRQQYVSGASSSGTEVLDPSPQNCHPRKEKKGGGGAHPLHLSLQESNPRVSLSVYLIRVFLVRSLCSSFSFSFSCNCIMYFGP